MFAVCARRTMAGAKRLHVDPPVIKPALPPPAVVERPKVEVVRSPVQMVIAEVAEKHGVTVPEMMSRSRAHRLVNARHEAIIKVATTCTIGGERIPLSALGRIFHRDHTSILHVLQKAGVR